MLKQLILARQSDANALHLQVAVAMKVVQGIYPGVTTRELDRLTAEICK